MGSGLEEWMEMGFVDVGSKKIDWRKSGEGEERRKREGFERD